jgi:hypothetical protein
MLIMKMQKYDPRKDAHTTSLFYYLYVRLDPYQLGIDGLVVTLYLVYLSIT